MRRTPLLVVLLALIVLSGCAHQHAQPVPQQPRTNNPWTNKPVLDSADRFQFAVIADFTGDRRPGVVEDALPKVNLMQPAFVMCVGDLIEGYTEKPQEILAQRDAVMKELDALAMRFYLLPGNHDITNPAMRAEWDQRYGRSYYHFVYRDVLFVCLNTEDGAEARISDEQARYVRDVLAQNQAVRWTFMFMHKPMWFDGASQENWKSIAAALAGRKHTLFAGHYHNYMYSSPNGSDHIVLSTTGGGSPLRGPMLGEFDGFVWVTMTEDGPVLANLALSGIYARDLLTEELARINEPLSHASFVHSGGIVAQEQVFKSGRGVVELTNDQPYELTVAGQFAEHPLLRVEPAAIAVVLPPGQRNSIELSVTAREPKDLAELDPLRLELLATYTPPGRKPIAVPSGFSVDVRGTQEGPELIRNSGVDGDGQPWFNWVDQKTTTGTVKPGNGTMQISLHQPPQPWSAGAGHPVTGIRPGARYRLTVRATPASGTGFVLFQLASGDKQIPVLVDGRPRENSRLNITPDKPAVLEFAVPRDASLTENRIIFLLGGLPEGAIDSVSLREVVAGKASKSE